jgi:hypothetical protein
MSVSVCLLVHGSREYFAVAREAILSVLQNSSFDVFVGYSGDAAQLPRHRRVNLRALAPLDPDTGRPYRFLLKFAALQACLDDGTHEKIVLMDADAMLARPLTEAAVERALGSMDFAMVEQKRIVGSDMERRSFLDHYMRHAVPAILPGAPWPELSAFRYYNSGVVLARRGPLRDFMAWAIRHVEEHPGGHEIGEHMITDQDYFQVWANSLHPNSCAELPWSWNHCRHWDRWFPRPGVLFAHFSTFCRGPRQKTPARMRRLRHGYRIAFNTIVGRVVERSVSVT